MNVNPHPPDRVLRAGESTLTGCTTCLHHEYVSSLTFGAWRTPRRAGRRVRRALYIFGRRLRVGEVGVGVLLWRRRWRCVWFFVGGCSGLAFTINVVGAGSRMAAPHARSNIYSRHIHARDPMPSIIFANTRRRRWMDAARAQTSNLIDDGNISESFV